jgi:N-acetylmuramoyl-L-alanine amidase
VLIATRVWPAQEYTRVTFEAAQPIKSQVITLKNPERLVLDLEGIDLNGELTDLAARVRADDPYIKQVRVARNKPTVVRVVLDLKTEVKATLFALPPVGDYKHRLVLDIYPLQPVDPLLALLSAGDIKLQPAPVPPERAMSDLLPKPDVEPRDAPRTELRLAMKVDAFKADSPVDKPAPKAMDKTKKPAGDMVRMITVAVDAGHGGEDPGARGRRGTHEKDVTLSIARRLKARIDAEPNMRAILMRDGDYFIPLQDRVIKARKVQADLFVSIHADAFPESQVQGSSVFALSERGATSAAARWLARRENEADLIGGVNLDIKEPYLARTLLDLSQTATISDSLKLGKAVLGELGGINRLHKAGVEQAGFAVLKAPDIPSILVETAFISNPEEENKLKDADYQDKLASAIVAGVKQYFARNPPLARTRLALQDK